MVLYVLALSWESTERQESLPPAPPPFQLFLVQKLFHFMMLFSSPDFKTYCSKRLGSTVETCPDNLVSDSSFSNSL